MRTKKQKDPLSFAIQKISQNQTAVGKSTAHQIKHLKIVRTIEEAEYTAYAEMAQIAKVKKSGRRYLFPPRPQDMARIKKNIVGYFSAATGKIYLNTKQSSHNLAKTIVHELIHKQNRERYIADYEQSDNGEGPLFRDEWRARLAEQFYDGKKPTTSVLRAAAKHAIEDNGIEFAMPNPLSMPEGTYVLPPYQAQFEQEIALSSTERQDHPRRRPLTDTKSTRRLACAFVSEQLMERHHPKQVAPITPAFEQRRILPKLMPLPVHVCNHVPKQKF